MPVAPRKMRLSAEHVQRVFRQIPDPGPQLRPGYRTSTDGDYAAEVDRMLATRPRGDFWVFAYGSLIWRPETEVAETRIALARGWHRRFCLGWDERFRGSKGSAGLMLALDRGGQCRGVVQRLVETTLRTQLDKLIRRESNTVPSPFPWRWIAVETDGEPLTALTFAMNRKSGAYVAGLGDDALAKVLAQAVGFRGSMAEYLFSTVQHLEELGIHDERLWHLQELVALEIEGRYGPIGG